jgi:hypothetical protein
MKEEIVISLAGLDLDEEEAAALQEHLRNQLVEFLKARGAPPKADLVALGPGWIGIETA